MNDLPAKRLLRPGPYLAGLAFAVVFVLAPTTLQGQEIPGDSPEDGTVEPLVKPLFQPRLDPLVAPLSLDAPQSLEPESAASGGISDAVPESSGNGSLFPVAGDIQINQLEAPDLDSIGNLGDTDGGFGVTAWQGLSVREAVALVDGLPRPIGFVTLRDLIARLLSSNAPPPESRSDAGLPAGGFTLKRLHALMALGAHDAARGLLNFVPGREDDQAFAQLGARLDLLEGAFLQVCGKAGIGERASSEVFWQRLLILCQALAGAQGEAELGLSLMQEIGHGDVVFEQLMAALMDQSPAELDRVIRSDALHIALFRLSESILGDRAVASFGDAPPDVQQALLVSPHLPADLRTTILMAMARSGALEPHLLRLFFEEQTFDEIQRASPISKANNLAGLEALALLYQASLAQQVDAARAEAVSQALLRARAEGLHAATAAAFLPVVKNIPPRTDLVWFADDAATVLIQAGELSLAQAWISLLRSASLLDSEVSMTLYRLAPLIHLSGLGQASTLVEDIKNWWAIESDASGVSGSRKRAAMLFTLLDALDPGRSAPLWAVIGGRAGTRGGIGTDIGLWHRLSTAGQARNTGQAVLLAAHFIGQRPPGDADPLALQHVIRNLVAAGFPNEARALAIEVAVHGGL